MLNTPYSPQLNPIEEVFAKWKLLVRKAQPESKADLAYKIVQTSKNISD